MTDIVEVIEETELDVLLGPPNKSSIAARNVHKRYGTNVVLNGINLTAPNGKMYVFVRPCNYYYGNCTET